MTEERREDEAAVPSGVPGGVPGAVLERIARRQRASGRYRPQGEVARGGMGMILRVWDEDLHRDLAMKVVLAGPVPDEAREGAPRGTAGVDPRSLGRFLDEAQVTGQLDHPGIVPVHELGIDEQDRAYFTMKLVEGRTLQEILELLERGAEDWTRARVLGVLLKVCEAMAYAHDKGVIHRDLKPANVMVGRFGEVYVMDWGLARVLGAEEKHDLRIRPVPSGAPDAPEGPDGGAAPRVSSVRRAGGTAAGGSPLMTMDGDIVGTPAYMSPEQAAGRMADMGPHSDVYSVGAMLYHLVAGRMPYAPSDRDVDNYAVWSRVQEGAPRPLHELAPDAPAELVAICEKAMRREIGARYRDMSELAADLQAYVEGRVVRAYEAGAWAEARKWVQRNKALAGALSAVLLLLVASLAVSLSLRQRADANAARADEKAEEARDNARRAELETDKLLSLADATRLAQCQADVGRLWPAVRRRAEIDAWLARVDALADNLPQHRATLADLRERALPAESAEEGPEPGDDARPPTRLELLRAQRSELVDALLKAPEDSAEAVEGQAMLERLNREIAEQEELGLWRFADAEDQWLHDALASLITDLEEFFRSGTVDEVLASLEQADWIEELTVTGDAARERWAEAIASVADPERSPAYGGLELVPQAGLLPIGRDLASGLWEFAHVRSGLAPIRRSDGTLELDADSAVVLVLVPGGEFLMGAQGDDPNEYNFDPRAQLEEAPVHPIELGPFFLSKYELSRAQWARLGARNPVALEPVEDPSRPATQISWLEAERVLRRADLTLPTEAQWEYAARGGEARWRAGRRVQAAPGAPGALADVGGGAVNGFGLHRMAGNVAEWCLDFTADYAWPPRTGDGGRIPPNGIARAIRGGSPLELVGELARPTERFGDSPDHESAVLGVRPARPLHPH